MHGRTVRIVVPLAAAAAVLIAVNWIDADWLAGIRQRAGYTFEPSGIFWSFPIGSLAAASGVLIVARIAWWSRSLVVGVAYVLVGCFYGFLYTLTWVFAAHVNGNPAIIPEPLAQVVGNIGVAVDRGPMRAVYTVGAGMVIVGLAVIARWMRDRRGLSPLEAPPALGAPAEPRALPDQP